MNIFDEADENLFRPLTGMNKRKYVDILALIWDKCKRMPMYAIQRVQFLLLSDGSVKSKINNMLQYYASQIHTKEDLYEEDDTLCADVFQVYGQNFFDSMSLEAPVKKRRSSPIELMAVIDELDMELVKEKNRKMIEYIRNALTLENVNAFAKDILKGKTAKRGI